MDFDVTKRVAVSRQGILAVIHNNEILVLDAKLVAEPVPGNLKISDQLAVTRP